MRYTPSEKMETIGLVEESDMPVKHTLAELDIPRSTFYDWCRRYEEEGYEGLVDRASQPEAIWNRLPDEVREHVGDVALDYPDKSPRQLAWFYTDTHRYFISASSVYRILKARDRVTSPVFPINTAADEFQDQTERVNEMCEQESSRILRMTNGIQKESPLE